MTLLAPLASLRAEGGEAKTEETAAPKDEKFNPKPMIMHHIADSHEFDVLDQFAVPLPCFLWSSATGVTTFLYHDGKEVNGYTCEHGGIERKDETFFLDLSITKNVFTMLLAAIIMIIVFTSVAKAYKTNKGKAPKGTQSVIEPLFVFIRDEVAKPGIGPKYEKYMPYIMTIFFFILTLNLLGLMPVFPGGANVTGNISFTCVLAFVAFLAINVSGTKHYWSHIFWMPGVAWPMKIFLAIIEVIGVFTKPVALMIRLFANMIAGHIIVLSLICLIFIFGKAGQSMAGSGLGAAVAVPFTLFISCIEVLVAFIQAFIFAMLTSVFIGMALEDHSEGHHTTD
ncbi:MAG: synthase subunit a [Bacteroidetes bacterium]|nr:synthase subunit a [Bacteroidota bacterium]